MTAHCQRPHLDLLFMHSFFSLLLVCCCCQTHNTTKHSTAKPSQASQASQRSKHRTTHDTKSKIGSWTIFLCVVLKKGVWACLAFFALAVQHLRNRLHKRCEKGKREEREQDEKNPHVLLLLLLLLLCFVAESISFLQARAFDPPPPHSSSSSSHHHVQDNQL